MHKDYLMKKLRSFFKDNAFVRLFSQSGKDQYRPEKHYMRGPGPRAKAKNGSEAPEQDVRPNGGAPAKRG
ncbi:MAG: hypothetical protein HC850_16030 [Rhodomicrobium sp.]|nr:hypothetical protein [Rhodomicrobium sp.]